MGDFSSISFSHDFALLPECAKSVSYFQSKDFPPNPEQSCCVDGEVRSDGLFVHNNTLWNPNLNGWVRLQSAYTNLNLFARFESGRIVEVNINDGEIDEMKLSPYAEASPETWLRLNVDINSPPSKLPPEVAKFLQGRLEVFKEELVVDGKVMTVLEVVQMFRKFYTFSIILAALALFTSICMAGMAYWIATDHAPHIMMVTPK
jgi:hypothetical protein